jgi:hypothetical protein
MIPNKSRLRKAKEDGIIDKMEIALSASYLLSTLAQAYIGEIDGMAQDYGLRIGEVKKVSNDLDKQFQKYYNEFKHLIDHSGEKMLARDFTKLKGHIDDFVEERNSWIDINDMLPPTGVEVIALTKNGKKLILPMNYAVKEDGNLDIAQGTRWQCPANIAKSIVGWRRLPL